MTRPRPSRPGLLPALFLAAALAGCSGGETPGEPRLGPVDGRDLPGEDLDRIRVGEPAPDFTLTSLRSGPVTLSDFRGRQNVLLVFYRGHW